MQVTGAGTSGWFVLSVGFGDGSLATGKLGVAFTAERFQEALEAVPRLAGRVHVTLAESARLVGPKAWDVVIDDGVEDAELWVDSRHSAGGSGLTGMSSPSVVVLALLTPISPDDPINGPPSRVYAAEAEESFARQVFEREAEAERWLTDRVRDAFRASLVGNAGVHEWAHDLISSLGAVTAVNVFVEFLRNPPVREVSLDGVERVVWPK